MDHQRELTDFLDAYNHCFYSKDLLKLREFYDTDNNVLIYFDNHRGNDTHTVEEHLELIAGFFNNGKSTESGAVETLIIEDLKIFNRGSAACLCFISKYKSFPTPCVRSTLYLERPDKDWKIVHAHFSFQPEK